MKRMMKSNMISISCHSLAEQAHSPIHSSFYSLVAYKCVRILFFSVYTSYTHLQTILFIFQVHQFHSLTASKQTRKSYFCVCVLKYCRHHLLEPSLIRCTQTVRILFLCLRTNDIHNLCSCAAQRTFIHAQAHGVTIPNVFFIFHLYVSHTLASFLYL